MEKHFWHDKWETNQIGFHESEVNPYLRKYIDKMGLADGSTVFVPLCGKTNDIPWLLQQGFAVVGAELSSLAIEQLFTTLDVTPSITQQGKLTRYSATDITIYVGDIFDISAEQLGHVDGIYDRAAVVALPQAMRERYANHLTQISHTATQLVVTFEYDQQCMPGPPFSVDESTMMQLYASNYQLQSLIQEPLKGGLKGKVEAMNRAWLLTPIT